MRLRLIIISFITLFLGLSSVFFYYWVNWDKSGKIEVKPVELLVTAENKGKRCERRRWDGLEENPYCYKLQEKLDRAISIGDLNEIVKALQLGANVNGTYYNSYSPVYFASMLGNKQAVILLIENSADVNQSEKWDDTPLLTAVQNNHFEIVQILLKNGADVCHQSYSDNGKFLNAPDIARRNGNAEIHNLLKQNGAGLCVNQYFPFK
jgi:hypothetical protein